MVHFTICHYHVKYNFRSQSTLYSLPECRGTPSSLQVQYLKLKRKQRCSNSQPLWTIRNTEPFRQTGKMIELCCEYLSARCIWLCVVIMSRTSLRVNPRTTVWLNVKQLLVRNRCHISSLSDSNEIRTHNHLVSFGVSPQSLICQNVKDVLVPTRQHYWILSDNNEIQTQNHWVRKRTLNHLPKVAKWLSCVVITYLYGAFDTMLLSCHVRASEYIYTL